MITVERTQTGVRIEKRMLKVLKALAEHMDMSLGELIECIVLHAFDDKKVFGATTLGKIEKLRSVYELTLTADDAHTLEEPA